MGDVTTLEPPTETRDLRAAFQLELERAGLSLTHAADQIGRHSSSISRWMNGTYSGNNDAIAAEVERWLRTRADAARHSLEGAGLDRHSETHATRKITNALAYAQAAGDIVSIVGEPGRGKTWTSQRYCAGKSNAFFLGVSQRRPFALGPALRGRRGDRRRAGASLGTGGGDRDYRPPA